LPYLIFLSGVAADLVKPAGLLAITMKIAALVCVMVLNFP